MADLGHDVVGVDVDEAKVKDLQAARAPFFEPGLPELLERAMASGRLGFTTDTGALARPDGTAGAAEPMVHFVCVGTPQRKGEFAADTTYVDAAVRDLLPYLRPGDLVVGKSTVPVGTAARLAELVEAEPGAMLAWNPEFLREGHAVVDTQRPDRLVYGLPADRSTAQAAQGPARRGLRRPPWRDGVPLVVTDYADRRAGQDGGERLPRHEDLVHQRDGRGLRGDRRRRHPARRRRSATTTGSARSSSAPGSASAAAACPRTSGRSWPAPASSAPTRR